MTSRKPKTGRRAGENDRRLAKEWVDLYRKAQGQPSGRLCLNPDDDQREQTWLDGNDPEHLLQMLENFARSGTFALVGDLFDSIRVLPLRVQYMNLLEAPMSHENAILALADQAHVSTRTIERWLDDKS